MTEQDRERVRGMIKAAVAETLVKVTGEIEKWFKNTVIKIGLGCVVGGGVIGAAVVKLVGAL